MEGNRLADRRAKPFSQVFGAQIFVDVINPRQQRATRIAVQQMTDIMQQRRNNQFIIGAGQLRQQGTLQGVFHLVNMFAIA